MNIVNGSLVDLAAAIEREYSGGLAAARTTFERAQRLGALLIIVKERLGHGEFETWVSAHCRFSHRSAQDYMRVARKTQSSAPSIKGALGLLRASRPGVDREQLLLPFDGLPLAPVSDARRLWTERERAVGDFVDWLPSRFPEMKAFGPTFWADLLGTHVARFCAGAPNRLEAFARACRFNLQAIEVEDAA